MKKFIKHVNRLICLMVIATFVFSFISVKADEEDDLVINSDSSYGDIKILKKDVDTDKAIAGVTFKLLDLNQNQAKNQDGVTVANATTDSNGFATFSNVAYGTYYIKEVSTPAGYKEKEAPIKFVLSKNNDAIILANSGSLNYMIGDINGDGSVNQADLDKLTEIISSNDTLDKLTEYVSDIDGDGIVDEIDLAILNAYLNGFSTAPSGSVDAAKAKICQTLAGSSSCDLDDLYLDEIYEMATRMTEFNNYLNTLGQYNNDGTFITNSGSPLNVCDRSSTDWDDYDWDEYSFELGDVNGDCVVDNKDATELTDCISTQPVNDEQRLGAGDLNGNESFDQQDLTILNNYLNNKSNAEFIASLIAYGNDTEEGIDEDEDVQEFIERIGQTGIVPQDIAQSSILITNEKIVLKISKLDKSTKKFLSGVTLEIKNAKGTTVKKYVTQNTYNKINIGAGNYTITEISAPDGYTKLKGSIGIRVYKDGSVKLTDSSSSLYKITNYSDIDSTLNHLVIYNASAGDVVKIPDTASNVQIIAIVSGLVLIIGGGYVIYKRYNKAGV